MDSTVSPATGGFLVPTEIITKIRKNQLAHLVFRRTTGLPLAFLLKFTEQQLFNYYYRLNPPSKCREFLREQLPAERNFRYETSRELVGIC